jgi:hypothetical protein
VVKLRGGIEISESGLMREMVGARLATHFGIHTPEPAVIAIEPVLAELIGIAQPSHAARIQQNKALFVTRHAPTTTSGIEILPATLGRTV